MNDLLSGSRNPLPFCALCLALLLAPCVTVARDERSQDRARSAVEAGEILPLQTVLQRVATSHPGQVLEVELERENGRWVYELKLLRPGGGLLKLELDAKTARPLEQKDRH